jgi:hypothetical protein
MLNRRDFLKASGVLTAQLIAGQTIVTSVLLEQASAMTGFPIHSLHARIGTDGSTILVPTDPDFEKYQTAFNLRTLLKPQVRVLVASPQSVASAIDWARANKIPFAIRSGGHSYEGFSQSNGMVIDTRLLSSISFDAPTQTVTVGAGVNLGDVYNFLSPYGVAIPAGSCPPVGVAGHTLGGGFGMIGRKYGLACDNLLSVEMVDAKGNILTASATENTDLFWALRGGGNGNLGIATQFVFQTHPVGQVFAFAMSWELNPADALNTFQAWQSWAPIAPDEITSTFKVSRTKTGQVELHCSGLSVGTQADLQTQLNGFTFSTPPTNIEIQAFPFIASVNHFAGRTPNESVYMKAKSDYIFSAMTDHGFETLMTGILRHPIGLCAIFDAYGGAVGRLKNTDTAFAHREGCMYVIQYYSEWQKATETPAKLASIRDVYNSMRPFVSGGSYVNYCDLDLKNGPQAYWGDNLPRLMQIKAAVDPDNFFKHAQSIPVGKIKT